MSHIRNLLIPKFEICRYLSNSSWNALSLGLQWYMIYTQPWPGRWNSTFLPWHRDTQKDLQRHVFFFTVREFSSQFLISFLKSTFRISVENGRLRGHNRIHVVCLQAIACTVYTRFYRNGSDFPLWKLQFYLQLMCHLLWGRRGILHHLISVWVMGVLCCVFIWLHGGGTARLWGQWWVPHTCPHCDTLGLPCDGSLPQHQVL